MFNREKFLLLVIVVLTTVLVLTRFNVPELIQRNFNRNNLFNFSKSTSNKTKSPSNKTKFPANVTRIIHQSWKNKDIPEVFHKYKNSWTNFCFKDWKYMFWTDEDNLNLIKNHYPWFLKKYNALPGNIYKADVSRYFYLFHYGGIYTDLDNECLQNFEPLLNYSLVFGAMVGQYGGTSLKEGYVQNSFMYSRERHPFWLEIIVEIMSIADGRPPEAFTGPILLSNKIRSIRERLNMTAELIVYPPHYFNPFSWLNGKDVDKSCKSHNQMTHQEWQTCRASMVKKGSYVVQYHAHTWG